MNTTPTPCRAVARGAVAALAAVGAWVVAVTAATAALNRLLRHIHQPELVAQLRHIPAPPEPSDWMWDELDRLEREAQQR